MLLEVVMSTSEPKYSKINCCCVFYLQGSCPPTYYQLMRKWLTFQSCLLHLTPLFTQLLHPQTKGRNLLVSPQQFPFIATLMHQSQLVPILHRVTFRLLTTPTKNWHRAGTGASLGILESKYVMSMIFWISTGLWNEKKKHKKRTCTHIIIVIHRASRRAMLIMQLLITPLLQTQNLLNDGFIFTVLYKI